MTRVSLASRLACVFALVSLVALLAGCGAATPTAASISGHDITRHDLNRDLDDISKNKALRNSASIQVASTPKGTLNSSITATWLTGLVRQVLIDREFNRLHLQVTAADRSAARNSLEQQQFGPQIFNGFSAAFRNRVVEREARIEALARKFTGGAQTQEAVNAAGQRFTLLLETGLRRGHVRVDPRYGRAQFGAQGFQIVPPPAPNVREKPGSTTTVAGAIPGG